MSLGAILATASQSVGFLEKWVAVLLTAVMTTAVAMQVFWRYVLSSPLGWTEEAARLCMIWMVFMVMGWAIGNRTHIAVGFLVESLSQRYQALINILITLSIAAFSGLLLVTGIRLVILQTVATDTPLGIPRSVFSLQVPISALFVLIHSADLLYQDLTGQQRSSVHSPGGEA